MKCVLELFFPIGIDNCNFFEKNSYSEPGLVVCANTKRGLLYQKRQLLAWHHNSKEGNLSFGQILFDHADDLIKPKHFVRDARVATLRLA